MGQVARYSDFQEQDWNEWDMSWTDFVEINLNWADLSWTYFVEIIVTLADFVDWKQEKVPKNIPKEKRDLNIRDWREKKNSAPDFQHVETPPEPNYQDSRIEIQKM